MSQRKLEIGQKLWRVYSDHRRGEPHYVVVTKVGRTWAEVQREDCVGSLYAAYKIHIETLAEDGGQYSSPSHCHLSREGYEASIQKSKLWIEVKRSIAYVDGEKLSMDAIQKIAELIGVKA